MFSEIPYIINSTMSCMQLHDQIMQHVHDFMGLECASAFWSFEADTHYSTLALKVMLECSTAMTEHTPI